MTAMIDQDPAIVTTDQRQGVFIDDLRSFDAATGERDAEGAPR